MWLIGRHVSFISQCMSHNCLQAVEQLLTPGARDSASKLCGQDSGIGLQASSSKPLGDWVARTASHVHMACTHMRGYVSDSGCGHCRAATVPMSTGVTCTITADRACQPISKCPVMAEPACSAACSFVSARLMHSSASVQTVSRLCQEEAAL